jgi:uncharacterized membrane protein YfcA
LIVGALAITVWIYLVWMVWKRKGNVVSRRIDPKTSEKLLKKVRACLIVAGVSALVFIVGAVVHNVIHGLSEGEETVSLFVSLVALVVFVAATASGLVLFLKEPQKQYRGYAKRK